MPFLLQIIGLAFTAGVFFTTGMALTCRVLKWNPATVTINMINQGYHGE